MAQRMVRIGTDGAPGTPEGLAAAGRGEVRELWDANKGWLNAGLPAYLGASSFSPWNPGQQVVVPAGWQAVPGEFEAK